MVFDPNKQLPGPLKTVNEEFFDAMIRHQIFIMRLSGGIRNKVIDILNATEGDIEKQILAIDVSNGVTPANIKKLRRLQKKIALIRNGAWNDVDKVWFGELNALAQTEPAFVAAALQTVVPVVVDVSLPAPEQLRAIVTTYPFEGKVMREWASKQRVDDLARIQSEIRIGMVQGESNQAIARRVLGTAAANGSDGATQLTRNQAAAITRTATNAIANKARRDTFVENDDIFSKEQYVATLDARTTPICRSLDGKISNVGEGPIPPLHFNCRSLVVAVIDGVELGNRPAKNSTRRLLLKEFTDKEKLKGVTTRDKLPRGNKGIFDKFERRRIREQTGGVPGKVTYQQWLTRQSAPFQDEVLGKAKGKLFRGGGLKLDKFVNRQGDELNLNQLARKHKDAFTAAGLDPEDFLK